MLNIIHAMYYVEYVVIMEYYCYGAQTEDIFNPDSDVGVCLN